MTLLDRVTALLDVRGIPHALIGAAALAAAGIARSTFDVDLLTCDRRVLQDDIWTALRQEGARVEVRPGDEDDPLGGVVRIEMAEQRPVDVILGKHAWQARAIERALRPVTGPPIVLAHDLVLLKLYAGGTQDLWDVRQLLEGQQGPLLRRQVDEALEGLPAQMRNTWTGIRG